MGKMIDDLKINLQSSFERSPDSAGERRALETGDNLSVPVLAEPDVGEAERRDSLTGDRVQNGEARDNTYEPHHSREIQRSVADTDSRGAQNFQQERIGDMKCDAHAEHSVTMHTETTAKSTGIIPLGSAASNVQTADAACPPSVASPTLTTQEQRQPSMRPSPVSGVTPPVHTRWKKGQSGNPGGRARHVSRAYIKHLETVVDEETGETNADKIAKAQIKKAYSEKDDGSTAAAREIRQATETDDEANKGGVSIGNLNMAIIQQIQRAATEGELE